MADKEKILDALRQLDPFNDDHWTSNGDPKMEAVEGIVGDKSITRRDIVEAAPDFNRQRASGSGGDENEQSPTPGEPNSEPSNPNPPGAPSVDPENDEPGEVESEEEDADSDTSERQSEIGKTPEVRGEVRSPANVDSDEAQPGEVEHGGRFVEDERRFSSELNERDVEDLEEAEREIRSEMEKVSGEITQLRERHATLKRMAAMARNAVEAQKPRVSNDQAIRDYIDSQNKLRANRLQRRQKLLQDISMSELQAQTPLDSAMARKTARGTQRPAQSR